MPTAATAQPAPPVPDKSAYRTPAGVSKIITWSARGKKSRVAAVADWLLVREHGVPTAEVFFTSYELQPKRRERPVMFLFNGGPGAASAFLHMGTAGPRRVEFARQGGTLPPPVKIVDNAESWLAFADLVFVDPVNTGLSRTVHESRLEQHGVDAEDDKREKQTKDAPEARKPFFKIKRDIDVLCEFVSAYLSRANRWDSPVMIAGESYGGYRVGKLVRALPERGVALAGAVMVSPAVDILGIGGCDYDILPWTNTLPTMALVARHHAKSRGRFASMKPNELRSAAEAFALDDLARALLLGDRLSDSIRSKTLATMADLTGLPRDLVVRHNGRVPIEIFGRELLRDEGKLIGLYDGTVTGPNAFPDREGQANPDPTLGGIMGAFTAAANTMLRSELALNTPREYTLLSEEAWKNWADDRAQGFWDRQLECATDLRYGMAINPDLPVLIVHGRHDLVTTYFSTAQTLATMRLPSELRKNVELIDYDGGHMFYTWEKSRAAVLRDVGQLARRG